MKYNIKSIWSYSRLLVFPFLLYCLFFLLSLSYNPYFDRKDDFITEIQKGGEEPFKKSLIEYNITEPAQMTILNPNYYFLFGKLYYKQSGLDNFSIFLLKRAIQKDNIFSQMAFSLLISAYLENGDIEEAFALAASSVKNIPPEEKVFWQSVTINKIILTKTSLPDKAIYFPIIAKTINSQRNMLQSQATIDMLHNYLLTCSTSTRTWELNNHYWNQIYYLSDIDPLIKFAHTVLTGKDKNLTLLKSALESGSTATHLQVIKRLAYKGGMRKQFYQYLKSYYKQYGDLGLYTVTREIHHYEGYKKASSLIKQALSVYSTISDENYVLRYSIIYNTSWSAEWVSNVVSLFNDYPDRYQSRQLVQKMLRSAVKRKQYSMVSPLLDKMVLNRASHIDQSIVLYNRSIMEPEKQFKEEITDNFPFSYASLRLNNGIIPTSVDLSDDLNMPSVKQLTHEGIVVYRKVQNLLQFQFYDDIRRLDIDELISETDQVIIYNLCYEKQIQRNDIYSALGYAKRIASLLYGSDHGHIDGTTLRRLFPIPYYDEIEKACKEFNIEPALALAVMREESHFKASIKSWATATGLMQIMPSTGSFIATKLGISSYDLTNPEDNIRMGVYYLRFLHRYFDETELILAGYNAGPGRVQSWNATYGHHPPEVMYELIPIYETRHYIRKVMRSYYIYTYLLNS